MSSKITFYGGVDEIGGNKFLIEDRGTKIFLDFGKQANKFNQFFAEFNKPRKFAGMGDLFEFGLLPKLKGVYRKDYAKHMDFGGGEDTEIHAIILTHAHVDHSAYIHYLRPDIPVYCSEPTKLLLQAMQDTGGYEDYVTFKENFVTKRSKDGGKNSKNRLDVQYPRKIKIMNDSKIVNIDSIEIEPISVDHSLPGTYGLIVHTSKGSIGYTADIRFHGRRRLDTQRFVDKCGNTNLSVLLCEGTRVEEKFSKTESYVEKALKLLIKGTKNLLVCAFPIIDLDRFLSFYIAAKETNRDLVIDLKQAYILKLFQKSDFWKNIYPAEVEKGIKIYIPRKGGSQIDKNLRHCSKNMRFEYFPNWAETFLNLSNTVDYRDVSTTQRDFLFCCNDFSLQELIDIRPKEDSKYIRSTTEPFDDEMRLDEYRVRNWLEHFGLIQKYGNWIGIDVSGHGSGDQIKKIIRLSKPKAVVPIHTEHKEYFDRWYGNITQVELNRSYGL